MWNVGDGFIGEGRGANLYTGIIEAVSMNRVFAEPVLGEY